MSNDRQMIAAAQLEPAAGGFAIRTPNLFGPARHYLVDEIQKAEIIAMMITRQPILKRAVLVMVLVMWIMALASLVWLYGAGRDNPTPTDLVVMTVLTVAPMVTALHLALRHVMRPLQPGFTSAAHTSPRAAIA
jgi:RsiW-degrading membrane proteinase PrsW (M82 family)